VRIMIVPFSVSDPATVVIVPVAVESEGVVVPIATTLCRKTLTACGSWVGVVEVVWVCAVAL
jgi:hypothetical protein